MDTGDPAAARQLLDAVDRMMARHLPREEVRRRDAAADPPIHLLPLWGQMGLLGLAVPERYGGAAEGAGDWTLLSLIQERLGWHGFMAAALFNRAVCFGAMSFLAYGSEAQKRRALPEIVAGRMGIALALTEPQAGSDAGALATRAERVPGGWRITGRKSWISGAESAAFLVMPCRTERGSTGGRGVTLFLVPPDAPGIAMTRLEKLGNRCSLSWDIGLDGVFVPEEAMFGAEGEGFRNLMTTLHYARSGVAAAVVGVAQAAVEEAVAHAQARVQFGRPIGAFQAIAHRLADMQTEVDLARLMARDLAARITRGEQCRLQAAQAKLVSTETLKRVTEHGMQIMASAGYAEGSDMQRYFRDARLYTFGEGSSEIQRDLIAREMGL
jgi:alkylation response protein AidB-like acyl-CoA dehydrogenase